MKVPISGIFPESLRELQNNYGYFDENKIFL